MGICSAIDSLRVKFSEGQITGLEQERQDRVYLYDTATKAEASKLRFLRTTVAIEKIKTRAQEISASYYLRMAKFLGPGVVASSVDREDAITTLGNEAVVRLRELEEQGVTTPSELEKDAVLSKLEHAEVAFRRLRSR